MKRTPLARKTPLKAKRGLTQTSTLGRSSGALSRSKGLAPVSAKARAQKRLQLPGEEAWKAAHRGPCSICKHPGLLVRHHVVEKKHIRDPALKYDMRNAMELGAHCPCHEWHTNAAKRVRVDQLPADAVAFAYQLFGDYAGDYLAQYYGPALQPIGGKDG
jgi:hypothetical protein